MAKSIWSGIQIPPAEVLNGVGGSAAERNIAVAASRSVVRLTYGTDRLAAQLLNILPSADGKMLVVQCLWGFAVDGVSELLLNDKALPNNATVTHYLGNQTAPDPALVAAMAAQSPPITYSASLNGFAQSVLLMPISAFDGELNVTALVRGRRLYDPRKDSTTGGSGTHRRSDPATWEYSDCPALATADWSSNPVYGAGRAVVWSSVAATADANDAAVGSEKRRTITLTLTGSADVKALGETMRAYAGCWVVPTASGLKFIPDQDQAPVDDITHASGRILNLNSLLMRDTSTTPTAVEVIYTDTTKNPWRDGSAIATLPGAGTTRPWRLSQVRMPGITRYSQAMREAIERLNKLTMCPLSTTVEVTNLGIKYERADIVRVSHPAGLSLLPMRVLDAAMVGVGTWQLQVQQHDAAAYSDSVQTRPVIPATGLDSPLGPPENVDHFTITLTAGNLRRFSFGYTLARPAQFAGVQIRYRAGEDPISLADWDSLTPLGGVDDAYPSSFETSLPPGGTFTFAARAMRMSGQLAASVVTTSATLPAPLPDSEAKDLTPPPTPTGVTVLPLFSNVMIEHAVPSYVMGHGHAKTIVYGALWTAGPKPTFVDAEPVAEFSGSMHAYPTSLGSEWHIWLKWETVDGVQSTTPAGGANGFVATTGKVGSSDLGSAIVLSQNLAPGSVTADKALLDIGGGNLVGNSSFEQDSNGDGVPDGWTLYDGTGGGSLSRVPGRITGYALRYTTTVAFDTWARGIAGGGDNVRWAPGKTYVLSFYARAPSGSGFLGRTLGPQWNLWPDQAVQLANPALTEGWQRYAWRIRWTTAAEPAGPLYLSCSGGTPVGSFEFDDVQVEEGDTLTGYSGKLAANTIVAGDGAIGNLAITNALIANLSVDDAKVANLGVAKLLAGALSVGQWIASQNFVAGSSGWQIKSDGSAEFSNIHIRGASSFDGQVTIRNSDGSVAFVSGGTWPSSSISPASGWLNSQIGINAAGQLYGVGAGSGTTVSNSQLSLGADGALYNAGTPQGQIQQVPVVNINEERETNRPPSWYGVAMRREFKRSASIGLVEADGYWSTLETNKQWTDNSGGYAFQYAYQNGKTWRRSAPVEASAWGAWTQDLDRNAYTGDLDATKGATIGANLYGAFSQASWDTVMSSAYIKRAHIDTGSFVNLAALSTFTGTLVVDTGGYLRAGKTDYGDATPGFFLGWSGGAHKFHLGTNTNYLRWNPTTGLEIKLENFTCNVAMPSGISGPTGSFTYASAVATVTGGGGIAPFTYAWTVTKDTYYPNLGTNEVWIESGQGTNTISIAGRCTNNNQNEVFVTCTITDANGRTAIGNGYMVATHGAFVP